jgi:hypothetical protein
MTAMSQRQYAKHRGVSRAAVQRAIREGRIETIPDGRIDADVADRQWEDRTLDPVAGAGEFVRARAIRAHYEARLAKIEYEERVGRLVPVEEVRDAAFAKYRQKRDAMLNIPDRLAAAVAAEADAAAIRNMLVNEIVAAIGEP